MSWEYKELNDSFIEEYEGYKLENQSHYEAVVRTFDENYSKINSDSMEKAVLFVISVELLLKQSRIYKVSKENYIRELSSIDFNNVKEHISMGQLNENEFEELYLRRNVVLKALEKMPVDLCPKVRWFYDEIVNTINTLFFNCEKIEDVMNNVLNTFQNEFRNKACAKKIVYTTIAENLIRLNKKLPGDIIDEIKDGLFDNSDFELTEEESQDLSKRIAKVLENLDS